MSETFAPQVPQWRVAFYRRPLWLVESLHLGLSASVQKVRQRACQIRRRNG